MADDPELRLDDRVAIVTGAGRGLGRAHALELARRGAAVVVNALHEETAAAVAGEIAAAGGRARAVGCTVASAAGAERIVAEAVDTFGGVDVLVANAGTSGHGRFTDLPTAEYDRVMDVNLRGTWEVTQAAWPHLCRHGRGRVVMTASASGLYGEPGAPQYGAAKAGTCGLAQSLAIEGAEAGVGVNVVCPAAFTPLSGSLIPEGEFKEWFRTLLPERVAQLVAWLAHEDCQVSGRIFGALGDVVVTYSIAASAVRLPGFRAEDLSAALADEAEDEPVFHGTLADHLAAVAALLAERPDAAAGAGFRLPGTDPTDTDPALN